LQHVFPQLAHFAKSAMVQFGTTKMDRNCPQFKLDHSAVLSRIFVRHCQDLGSEVLDTTRGYLRLAPHTPEVRWN